MHMHTQPLPVTAPDAVTEKPTRLAIGIEGGFDGGGEKKEIEETLSVISMPELTSVPWPCDKLPHQVGPCMLQYLHGCVW